MKTFEFLKLMIVGGAAVATSSLAFAQDLGLNPDPATVAVPVQGGLQEPLQSGAAVGIAPAESLRALTDYSVFPAKVTPDVSGIQRVLVVGCRYADTVDKDVLNNANEGIRKILDNTRNYFNRVSNGRVNFFGDFDGWRDLPKSSGDYANEKEVVEDCKDLAKLAVAERGTLIETYRAIVMLFNRDKHIANATGGGTGVGEPQYWIHLRFSGGTGGGWTSEALWAHELGHAFGLLHTTFPTRDIDNQYNDFQDAMSGFAQSSKRRWNFPATGFCNGILAHPECLYKDTYDKLPVHYSAFQKQRLGWLFPDQIEFHWGGTADYYISAPTYDPTGADQLRKKKLVMVKVPYSSEYYAIEYRRGDHGDTDNAFAFNRGWEGYETGIRSDRLTVYLIEPDLYSADKDQLGDANLMAVLKPGERFTAGPGNPAIDVFFEKLADGNTIAMRAKVTVTTALPAPPTTVLSAAGMDRDWANQDVVAQLFPSPDSFGTPIANTYYGVDDPGCNEQTRDCAIYSNNFTIAGEGVHDVTYFSADIAGGIEPAKHKAVRIDKSAPSTVASISTSGAGAQLTISATDSLSGVADTLYGIDGNHFETYRGPIMISGPGAHTVRIRSYDKAGNAETPQDLAFEVPALPLTAKLIIRPSKIVRANGRPVPVHVDFRSEASGITVHLDKVSHNGKGRHKGWTVNTADVDGVVYANRGATYTLKYTLTDASGRTLPLSARIAVGG